MDTTAPEADLPAAKTPELLHSGARVVVDGIVHKMNIYAMDGAWYLDAEDMAELFGGDFGSGYASLDGYAQETDIRYTQDEVLEAAYFCTWDPYAEMTSITGFESYAQELGLPLEPLALETVSGSQMAELLDCFVAHEAPEQMEGWKKISRNLRDSDAPLARVDALAALYLAAWQIGGVYMDYEIDWFLSDVQDILFDTTGGDASLFRNDAVPSEFDVGGGAKDHYGTACCIYNFEMVSPVDGDNPFSYDGTSFRYDEKATYLEAAAAILRVYSITQTQTAVSVNDPAAVTLSACFTDALRDKAMAPSRVSADNHPQWTGFCLEGNNDMMLEPFVGAISDCGNWGFNGVRLLLSYEQIFNRDVTEVNLKNLGLLDEMVAEAVKYNMHLNIQLISLPGRWVAPSGDFENIGEYDLFLNGEKQTQAKRVFEILARRYQGISNDYLSLTPTFEILNYNLSTGHSYEPYTLQDAAPVVAAFADTIREIDPDRLIMIEPGLGCNAEDVAEHSAVIREALAGRENILYSFDFVSEPFCYACMTAAADRGVDDDNRSYYLQKYPAYFYMLDNCIVDPQKEELREWMPEGTGSGSLLMDGFLPAGTTIDLYINHSSGGQLQFAADGEMIYTQDLEFASYDTGEALSRFFNYAITDKKITVTLPEDTKLLEIAAPGGAAKWTAMDLWLPEEYAREHWYYVTAYDVYHGLEEQAGIILKKDARVMIWPYEFNIGDQKENRLTIHEDLTFSTPTVWTASTRETIEQMVSAIAAVDCGGATRGGGALFNGGIWEEMVKYYDDVYSCFNAYDVSWWCSEWWTMTNDMSASVAGVQQTDYQEYSFFNLELLKWMQQYQNSERP